MANLKQDGVLNVATFYACMFWDYHLHSAVVHGKGHHLLSSQILMDALGELSGEMFEPWFEAAPRVDTSYLEKTIEQLKVGAVAIIFVQ